MLHAHPHPSLAHAHVSFVDPTAANRDERVQHLSTLPNVKGQEWPEPAARGADGRGLPGRLATANTSTAEMQAPAAGECRRVVPDNPTSLPVVKLPSAITKIAMCQTAIQHGAISQTAIVENAHCQIAVQHVAFCQTDDDSIPKTRLQSPSHP